MYTLYVYDDMTCDEMIVAQGTLEECEHYIDVCLYDEHYSLIAPDGYTEIESRQVLFFLKETLYLFNTLMR